MFGGSTSFMAGSMKPWRALTLSRNGRHLSRLLANAVVGHLSSAAKFGTKTENVDFSPQIWFSPQMTSLAGQVTVLKGWNATRVGSLHSFQPQRIEGIPLQTHHVSSKNESIDAMASIIPTRCHGMKRRGQEKTNLF